MPTYDYRCAACGHEFEAFQSITASPLKKCPQCGKRRLERLIGPGAAVIFRGSGFYCTDYRKNSSPPPSSKPAASGKTGSSDSPGPAKGSGDGGGED